MISFIVRRLLYMIPVLAGVLCLTMVLFFGVSEDPVLQYASQSPTPSELRALRSKYELDVPAFFSPSWLRGEDILDAERREQLLAIVVQLDAIAGEVCASQADIDAFRRRWHSATSLEGRDAEINADIARLCPELSDRVDFSSIALTDEERGEVERRSIFDAQIFRVARMDFGESMQYEESIWTLIRRKAPISLSITLPIFFIALAIELALSLFAASRRGRPTDSIITIIAVLAMSIPFVSYVISGQWMAAATGIVPVSGWEPGLSGVRYLVFPVAIGVVAGLGSAIRFYRAVLLEEMDADYVRTARAKGVRQNDVLFIHVLRNAGIPIVTRLSVIIPFLITGSLLIERMFEIPGLGDLLFNSIRSRDFWVVMPLTYLLSITYSLCVLLTDVVYALVDPRVRVS